MHSKGALRGIKHQINSNSCNCRGWWGGLISVTLIAQVFDVNRPNMTAEGWKIWTWCEFANNSRWIYLSLENSSFEVQFYPKNILFVALWSNPQQFRRIFPKSFKSCCEFESHITFCLFVEACRPFQTSSYVRR